MKKKASVKSTYHEHWAGYLPPLPEKVISSEVGWEPMVMDGVYRELVIELIKLVEGLPLSCDAQSKIPREVSLLSSLRALPLLAAVGPVYQHRTSGCGWGNAQRTNGKTPPPLKYLPTYLRIWLGHVGFGGGGLDFLGRTHSCPVLVAHWSTQQHNIAPCTRNRPAPTTIIFDTPQSSAFRRGTDGPDTGL